MLHHETGTSTESQVFYWEIIPSLVLCGEMWWEGTTVFRYIFIEMEFMCFHGHSSKDHSHVVTICKTMYSSSRKDSDHFTFFHILLCCSLMLNILENLAQVPFFHDHLGDVLTPWSKSTFGKFKSIGDYLERHVCVYKVSQLTMHIRV